MKRILKAILKWLLRILLVIFALLVLAVAGFYIFNGPITKKAVRVINEQQPGEVSLGDMRLRPFMNFPDVSLKLNRLQYSPVKSGQPDYDSIPVFRLQELYVSLDVVKLLRGEYRVSEVRLEDGMINYIVASDTVSNLEQALGIRFGAAEPDTVPSDSSTLSLDMKSLKMRNVLVNYFDETTGSAASLFVNHIESQFSYFPEMITAGIDLDLDLNRARSGDIMLDRPRNIRLISDLSFDPLSEKIDLREGSLKMRDTELALTGMVELGDEGVIDLQFDARNQGIELLNFLLSGVLDMDAIEQIGDGSITLNGRVSGAYQETLPVLELNFAAEDIGFYVRSIDQSVTGITFSGKATNGALADLSQAMLQVDRFGASFPDGEINASLRVANLLRPEVKLKIDGNADLNLIEEIVQMDELKGLEGKLALKGDIDGVIDESSGNFLDGAGELTVGFEQTAFRYADFDVDRVNGELFVDGWNMGFRDLKVGLNDNLFQLNGNFRSLLPYLYGFNVNPSVSLGLSTDELYVDRLIPDTAEVEKISEPIRDLGFRMNLTASPQEIEQFLETSTLPDLKIYLSDFGLKIPGYSEISRVKFLLQLSEDKIRLSNLKGRVGSSRFEFDLLLSGYNTFLEGDSLADVGLEFRLESPRILAADLLTINDEFMVLPADYQQEEMEDFVFSGRVSAVSGALMQPAGALPDFRFTTDDMHWAFRYYPLEFKDFNIDIEHRDSVIDVHRFDGAIGESNFALNASFVNLLDSVSPMSGRLEITSGLLDLNQLLNYELPGSMEQPSSPPEGASPGETLAVEPEADGTPPVEADVAGAAVAEPEEGGSPGLDQIDYPDFALNVHIDELRYEGNILYGLEGRLRSSPFKVIYLDRFRVQSKTGGTVLLDGQFNVSRPDKYLLSANFKIDTLNLSDFAVEFAMEDTVYSLSDNFTGKLNSRGMAEVFLNPDLSVDLEQTTASLNFALLNGSIKKFTPIQEVSRFTGNKDLDNIRFGKLSNPNLSLLNKKIHIPLMSIESTLGLLLLEGEQSLEGDYMYLVRVPNRLIRQTTWNVLSNKQNRENEEEDEIVEFEAQRFMRLTVFSLGEESGVKTGDERTKLREQSGK